MGLQEEEQKWIRSTEKKKKKERGLSLEKERWFQSIGLFQLVATLKEEFL